jgi:hypothetical protein
MFFLQPLPAPSNLTPPSPTGRGRKYSEKMVIERGLTEFISFFSPSLIGEGAGVEVITTS